MEMQNKQNKMFHSKTINKQAFYRSLLIRVIGTTMALILSALPAIGAEFSITPIELELTPRAGETVREAIKIINQAPEESQTFEIILTDLTQRENASFWALEPNDVFDRSKLSSCKDWVRLSTDSVELGPRGSIPLLVTIRVPRGARGFYSAALLVAKRPGPDTRGVALITRFLIPILIEVQGRPMRHQVEMEDVGMEYLTPPDASQETTIITGTITNNGGTYSRIQTLLDLKAYQNEHWLTVTTTEFKLLRILPGSRLKLIGNLRRPLPSGKYSIKGLLRVDGRRVKSLEKEIDFVSNPNITKLAIDTSLDPNPSEVFIDAIPGATRTKAIRLTNSSQDNIIVRARLVMPPPFKGTLFGELRGEDLACLDWLTITPEEFELRGGRRQSLRVSANMPNQSGLHASYYAILALSSVYEDGQNAGWTTVPICVTNKKIETVPAVKPVKLTLGAMEESKYIVIGRFGNVGNIYLNPNCKATVTNSAGRNIKQTLLSGTPGMMLPLEIRDFSGIIDFAGVAAGMYRLVATLEFEPDNIVVNQVPIWVYTEGDRRIVEIIKPEQFEEAVGVEW